MIVELTRELNDVVDDIKILKGMLKDESKEEAIKTATLIGYKTRVIENLQENLGMLHRARKLNQEM
jgi:hypothetical protein